MITYRQDIYPPVPVLEIRLSRPLASPQTEPLLAMIDTGSDSSLIPMRWIRQIKVPVFRSAFVRGMWGGRKAASIYAIDLHLTAGILPHIEVTGIDDEDETFENEEIILGRNVLNKLILLLEGPKQQTTILERRPLRF